MSKFLKDMLVEASVTATEFIGNGVGLTGVRPYDDVINIIDHGATGDGTTDDTAAIQAALTAAAAAKQMVHVPPGTYRITTVTVPDGVPFCGVGVGSILVRKAASNASMVVLGSASLIEHMALNGNAAGQSGSPGAGVGMIQAGTSESGAAARDCTLTNGWGCGFAAALHPDFEIARSSIDGIANATAIYVTQGCHRPRITHNRITNCSASGIQVRATDSPVEATPLYLESPIVTGNVIDYRGLTLAAAALAIEMFGAANSGIYGLSGGVIGGSISDNQIFAPDQTGTEPIFGISVGGGSGTTIEGNSLIGGPELALFPGMECAIGSQCVFASNYISGAQTGITVSQNTEHVSIATNTIIDCVNGGIAVSANSLGLKIIGNTFRDAGLRYIFMGVSAADTSIVGTMVRSNHFYTSAQSTDTFVGFYSTATGGGVISGTTFDGNLGGPIAGGTGTAGLRMVEINGGGIDAITGNRWDCANPAGTAGADRGLLFQPGSITGVLVRENAIANASTAAFGDLTSGGASNRFIANRAISGTVTDPAGFAFSRADNVAYANTPPVADNGYPDDFTFASDLITEGSIVGPGGQSISWASTIIDISPTAITKLRVIDAGVFGTNDSFFQALPGASGYGVLENWGGLGFVLNGNGTDGLRLAVGRTAVAAFGAAGMTLVDVPTAPTVDPVGGGILYSDSGLPMWRDPTGTVTALAGGGGGGAEYSATIGDGATTDIAVAHGLGSRDVSVTIRQAATPYATALVSWDATDVDTVTLHFTTAPTAGQYRATVMAGGVSGGGGGGSGTVTSVALTVPAGLSVTGSPITASGTFAISTALAGMVIGTGTGFATAVAGTDYLDPTWAGSASLDTVGTITTGTWQGTPVALAYGGTGATTAAGARTALGLASLTSAAAVVTTVVTANAASTTTAQNLMSYAVPAGLLNVAGKSLQVFGAGVLSVNTTSTVTIAVRLGGVVLATWTSASITGAAGTANSPWNFEVVAATVATGATGTIECHGRFHLKPTTGAGTATVYNDIGTGPSAAVDLTAGQTLQITVTFSANGAGGNANACTQRLFHVEQSN